MKTLVITSSLIAFVFFAIGCSAPKSSLANNSITAQQPEATPSIANEPTEKPAETPSQTPSASIAKPGDPKLTLEIVTKNINAYLGKRVRWFGQYGGGQSKGSRDSHSYNIQAFYVNDRDKKAKDFLCFSVSYESKEMFPPEKAWVTGTIKGTDVMNARITSKDGKESAIQRKVPLLINPEFEEVKAKNQ